MHIMNQPEPIYDILLAPLTLGLILGGLGVVLFTNLIYSAISLGLVLACIGPDPKVSKVPYISILPPKL